jgi:hypothetical protein
LFPLFDEWFIGDILRGIPVQDAILTLINSGPVKALNFINQKMILWQNH